MAKINPLLGKGTGKVGAFLLQVNSGVQILKEKPVSVANPQTDAQVEQRAKLKLMSQLAADLSQTIGFQKKGLVSARNQFISANIGKCTFADGKASVLLYELDLTGANASFPELAANPEGPTSLATAAPANVNAVLYAVYGVGEDGQLQLADQKIVSVAGANNTFPTTLVYPGTNVGDSYVLFAYGIQNNGKAGIVSYENYSATVSEEVALLSYVRSVIVKGGSLTKNTCVMDTIQQ